MLIEGLRAELPEVFALASWRPVVPRMSPWLAALAALGVGTLTTQLLYGAHALVAVTLGLLTFLPLSPPAPAETVIGSAVATAFAFGAAGRRGVLAAVSLFSATGIGSFAVRAPALLLFCSRSGPSVPMRAPLFGCELWRIVLNDAWPAALGIVVGLIASRSLRTGPTGVSVLGLAVGLSALAYPIALLVGVLAVGPTPEGAAATALAVRTGEAQMVVAFVVGIFAGVGGRRHVLDGLAIAGLYLLPWLPLAYARWKVSPPPFFDARDLLPLLSVHLGDQLPFVPVGYAAAALVGLAVGALAAKRLRPKGKVVRST